MSFWDDISRKVTEGTRMITRKSGEVFEITKVRLDIAAEKDKINKLYEEIGKIIYEDYEGGRGEIKSDEIAGKCQLIDEIRYKIKRLNQKAMQIKGGSLCRECGEAVSATQRFCHQCGRELEQVNRVVEDNEAYKVEVVNGLVCNECGTLNQRGSGYCSSCGGKI